MDHITLDQILTPKQIRQCQQLYPDRLAIRDQVIVPHLPEINAKLGQDNNPDYLSYLVIYVLDQVV